MGNVKKKEFAPNFKHEGFMDTHQFYQNMEKFNNGEYLAPQVEVVELNAQGIICESVYDVVNPYGGNNEFVW